MLSGPQLAEFGRRGILRLPGFVPADVAAGVAARVWDVLSRRGVDRDRRSSWPVGRALKLQSLTRSEAYEPFVAGLSGIADQVLGPGRWLAVSRPFPLVTFPTAGAWAVPTDGWHFDLPARGSVEPPIALRVLGVVEPLAPGGGGTLAVEGTHELTARLVARAGGDFGRSVEVRRSLASSYEWFRALAVADDRRERFLQPEELDGVEVKVTELHGDAGDIYLMHPWVMHAAAANTGDALRSMFTHTVFGDGYRFAP